ncbi:MAG: hypothetical protein U0794_21705 [Isosphaeraceae bacterium]
MALAAGLALLNVGLYWVAIPYRTQQRFMLQALGLAAVPLGRGFDRSRALRWLGLGLLAVHLLTPQGWPLSPIDREPPWDLNGYVPNRVPALIPFPVTRAQVAHALGDPAILMGWLITVVLGLASLGVGWFWIRSIQQPSTRALARSSVATAGVFLFAVAIQAPSWPDARRQFFPPFPDYIRGWLELDQRSGQQGARIAYAGTDLPYYLQGVGLRNTVRYINIDEHRDWLLHDYHRAASLAAGRPVTWDNTRPGWDRIQPRYDAWLDNLHAEQIQLLVVTRANPDEGRHNVIPEAGGYPIERLWADSHPEAFELLYGDSQADPRFRIYRVIPRATERLPGR